MGSRKGRLIGGLILPHKNMIDKGPTQFGPFLFNFRNIDARAKDAAALCSFAALRKDRPDTW
jgi:hypothetical protein